MKNLVRIFTIFVFFLASVSTLSAQNKNSVEGDYEALVELYQVTDGASWYNNSGWESMTPETMGSAYGITVYPEGHQYAGRVQRINLFENNLVNIELDGNGRPVTTGEFPFERYVFIEGRELPESIGNLRQMLSLQINKNRLSGPIPSSFWTLNNLEVAALGYEDQTNYSDNTKNDLVNETSFYPSKGDYHGNKFTLNNGVGIPPEIRNMTSLKRLFLERNYFDNTTIPAEITDLQLEKLMISSNGFVGNFPDGMDKLADTLDDLQAYGGNAQFNRNIPFGRAVNDDQLFLTGQIKEELGYLDKVEVLRIDYNRWAGGIPESFVNLSSLRYVYFAYQEFDGPFPELLNTDEFPGLNTVRLEDNNFTGSLSQDYNPSSFRVFTIDRNDLSGNLPDAFADSDNPNFPKNIIILSFLSNNFEGGFAQDLSSLNRLRQIRAEGNNLSGNLPHSYPSNDDLRWLRFDGNNFSGPIPQGFSNITSSVFIDISLSGNNLTSYEKGAIAKVVLDESGDYVSGLRGLESFGAQNNSLSQSDLNQIILDLWANVDSRLGTEYENWDDATLNISGQSTGEGPSNIPEINDAINNLESAGWTIVFDGDRTHKGELQIPDAPLLESPNDNADSLSVRPNFSWTTNTAETYTIQITNEETGSVILEQNIDGGSFTISEDLNYSTTHSWQVRASLNGNAGAWSDAWTFKTIPDQGNESGAAMFPNAPVLYGPDHRVENEVLTPQFTWSDIDADYYILHVSRMDPTGMVLDVVVDDTTFTPSEILGDNSVYDWRVRGVKNGELGDWSKIRRLTTLHEGLPPMADLVSPAHFGQEVDPLTELVWEDVGADTYEIRLMNKETSEFIFEDVTTTSIYMPKNVLPDTTEFIWQVKSNKGGVQGAWGPRWEFSTGIYTYSVDTPSLIAPNPGSEYDNLTPIFEWSAVDADHYHISVTSEQPSNAKSVNGALIESVVIYSETTETQYMPETDLEPETKYYWRVKAVKDENEGEWSEAWEFTTPKEQLSTSTETGEQPLQTSLAQNYPNPFNPTTQIEFTLSEMQDVSIKVYDMAGRQVATLFEGLKQAGRHSATFDASSLSSGIYIYRFRSGSNQFSRKMTLIK